MNFKPSARFQSGCGACRVWLRLAVLLSACLSAAAADLAEARKLLGSGRYSDGIKLAAGAIADDSAPEEWHHLLIDGLMTVGRYPDARNALTNALGQYPRSIRLRWAGRDVQRFNGHPEIARAYEDEIRNLVGTRPSFYSEPADLLVVGRLALLTGVDPKTVMTRVLDPVKKADPTFRDAYVVRGELAVSKHDFDLAAKAYAEGLKEYPNDAGLHHGMALAFAEGDREQMGLSLEEALKANPKHVPSLLLLADHRIDAEDYAGAGKLLDEVSSVNPWHPNAWAYRAVLAHLRHDSDAEATARASGLKYWTNNPHVDHLIGKKLSQKYRFAEGAAAQRVSLSMDASYLPAKAQLASDLLRLGDDVEGWRLAQEIHQTDGYDVAAFNLVTLHDTMAKFTTLTNADFVVRMNSREAEIFGARVLGLLGRAREKLVGKYGFEIKRPTTVEIFNEQKDFGVRTFGMPENPGYLGVCFGRVITANSPSANKGNAVNWEAVLWHEFCHVVTLQMTANRMPRWLSEGISVYEELQENATWGQRMTPRYRGMILDGELTPVSKLSAAFLSPKTPFHLQFAYYESALVVEFIVSRSGMDKLRAVLNDLREGAEINAALAKHILPMDTLEKDFAAFAKDRAKALAPGLDWEKPKSDAIGESDARSLTKWAESRPTNYWALMQKAGQLVTAKKWADAKGPLQKLVELYPEQTGKDSAYPLLAHVHRALGETNEELRVLREYAGRDDEAADAYLRLAELGAKAGDWEEVARNSRRFLAVNPLVPAPYRYLAQAAEAQGDVPTAVASNRTLLQLDPPNPAEVHFHLARLLHRSGDAGARRHVLEALTDAPRHRAALQLLLEINANPNPRPQ